MKTELELICHEIEETVRASALIGPVSEERAEEIQTSFAIETAFRMSKSEGSTLSYSETETFLFHELTANAKAYEHHTAALTFYRAVLAVRREPLDSLADCRFLVRELNAFFEARQTGFIPAEAEEKIAELLFHFCSEKVKSATELPEKTGRFFEKLVALLPDSDGLRPAKELLTDAFLRFNNFLMLGVSPEERSEYDRLITGLKAGENSEEASIFWAKKLLEAQKKQLNALNGEGPVSRGDIEQLIVQLKSDLQNAEGAENRESRDQAGIIEHFIYLVEDITKNIYKKSVLFKKISLLMVPSRKSEAIALVRRYDRKTTGFFYRTAEKTLRTKDALFWDYQMEGLKDRPKAEFRLDACFSLEKRRNGYRFRLTFSDESVFDPVEYIIRADRPVSLSEAEVLADRAAECVLKKIRQKLSEERLLGS